MAFAASTSGQAFSAVLIAGENETRKARLNTAASTFFIIPILSYWLKCLKPIPGFRGPSAATTFDALDRPLVARSAIHKNGLQEGCQRWPTINDYMLQPFTAIAKHAVRWDGAFCPAAPAMGTRHCAWRDRG